MNTADIANVLKDVIDPELGISIVSLGLIYGIEVDDGAISVEMSMTSPSCPMGDVIAGMAAGRLRKVADGRAVSLEIVDEPHWRIEMADATALRELGLVRG